MIYLVMGVAGAGKTTVGALLAARLGLPFFDADDHHPAPNIEKMKAGIPLTDKDREAWLEALSTAMEKWEETGGAVLACSALKERYRAKLRDGAGKNLFLVYLKGDRATIEQRMAGRRNHFFNRALIESQYAALEEPSDALTITIELSPDAICRQIEEHLALH